MNIKNYISITLIASSLMASIASAQDDQNLDDYFRAMDEVQALEQHILETSEKKLGPLTSIFACVSANVAANATAKVMEESIQKTMRDSFNSIPFGGKLLEEMEKADPTVFNISIDKVDYETECNAKISDARHHPKITDKQLAVTIRLSEFGGKVLGAYMTQGLND